VIDRGGYLDFFREKKDGSQKINEDDLMADVDANRKRGAPGVQVATLGPSDGTGVLAGDLVTPNDNPVVVKPMVASPSAKRDQKGLKKDGEQEGNNKIWICGLQAGVPPGAMKTMSHNCRGAGDPATVRKFAI
jgi:hypothetical protein